MSDPALRVVSLGAGVQSSTLLLRADRGLFGDVPDAAIFADTQSEPAAVYDHLDFLEEAVEIPVLRVTAGSLEQDALAAVSGEGNGFASLPLYVENPDGEEGMLRRQCTREYKIQPIYRAMTALLEERGEPKRPGSVELWLGITVDEAVRMRDARVQWVRNRWPLIEQRWTRRSCLTWLEAEGFPRPPKSACYFCPYHHDGQWQELREDPEEWARAVEFDRQMRELPRIDGEAFLHRSLVPLEEAPLGGNPDQLRLFNQECEGMCGV